MNKKLLSIAMALLLAAAPLSVAASADEDTAEEKSTTGTIFFDVGDWNHDDKICFYMWDATTGLNATNKGWQEGNFWGSKKILGTPVEGKDGIFESYEVTLYEGHDTFVIFHDQTTNEQTFNCVLTPEAIGKTAHMAEEVIENPEDSEKTCIAAVFDDAEGCGPQLTITSTGNVVGQYMAPNANPAKEVAQYLYKRIGTTDKSGVECCSEEKVNKAIEAFGTTANDVWAEFQSFNGKEGYEEYADKEADVKAALKIADEDPDAPKEVTGTIFFDMGDWNHDDKVCFYIWDATTGLNATNKGWQEGNFWGSKKILGTPVEGKDGIVESYEITLYEGHDTFVIFHDQTTNEQTFNCVLTPAAIGQTAHMADERIENPVDSEKTDIAAVFDGVEGCGPQLTITSTGNVVGQYSAPSANGAATVAQFVFDRVGTVDKSGVECCTVEKVATAIEKFGTTADDVWAEFQKLADKEGYAEKADPAKAVIFGEEPAQSPDEPVQSPDEPVQSPDEPESVTGTIFFDMGAWNHDDKICFYIWDATTGLNATNKGWQEGNFWGSKKILGTPVEGKDGIVESYEITLYEGHDTFVIFHDQTTNEQTFNCVLTPAAIGKTAHMADEHIENPEDSEKTCIAAIFDDAEGCGPQLTITSTGNVVGQYMAPNANPVKDIAEFIYKRVGTVDKTGVECCSAEKVAAILKAFDASADDVWAEFEKFEGQEGREDYAEKKDPSHDVLFPTEKPNVMLGDVDGDGKVSAKDALVIQRYTIKLAKLDDAQLAAADVDGDGKVSGKDALVILRYSINLAKIPPEKSGSAA